MRKKFRVWNITQKKYIDGLAINNNGELFDIELGFFYGDDMIAIEQYTGLKDNNGVEIYEGDIIVYVSLYENHSDAMDYFDVEPQNNFSVDEVYLEKKKGVVVFEKGAFYVNGNLLHDAITGKVICEKIIFMSDCYSLGCSLREYVFEEKQTWEVKNFKDIFKNVRILGNIHENPELLEKKTFRGKG